MLRGTPKTEVKIKVLRQGEVLDFVVKRAKIEMNPVPFYKMIDDEVGYISFVKFNKKASKEVKKAYRDLKEQGMKKLILDIRGNPGGLLNQAVAITNFFIPKDQLVVTTKAKVKKWSTSYRTKNDPIDLEIPIVVLINGRSASASEIVSGALQDYDRAVIMGERSFGKGLVQRYRELAYGTQMKLTISKYYIPSGRCIQELDYTNKDKDGNVPKFSDGKINKFKTANGRKVYDGGGVLPDVEIEKPKTLDLTKKLLSSDAMFHFVTAYYYAHNSIAEPNQFKLEDKVYVDFMSYLRTHPDEFETASDHKLEEALDIIEKEGYKSEIETSFSSFKQEAIDAKLSQLDTNKDEIIAYLTAEIVKRYYYKEGVFKQKMAFDPVIVEAASLLNNERAYKKVLR
jgi:carboxyl-terminal processing protease